jgi:HAE1 family hydrophobic/amphiphilic exporter-1
MHGLSIPQVQQVILSSNLDFPTGNIQTREKKILIRLAGKYKKCRRAKNLVVSSKNGIQVRYRMLTFKMDKKQLKRLLV